VESGPNSHRWQTAHPQLAPWSMDHVARPAAQANYYAQRASAGTIVGGKGDRDQLLTAFGYAEPTGICWSADQVRGWRHGSQTRPCKPPGGRIIAQLLCPPTPGAIAHPGHRGGGFAALCRPPMVNNLSSTCSDRISGQKKSPRVAPRTVWTNRRDPTNAADFKTRKQHARMEGRDFRRIGRSSQPIYLIPSNF